ncbi:MAG: AAA family ATPase [Flexilinea sp.]|nr:AAA family ATPase [Flexilinea sp.]
MGTYLNPGNDGFTRIIQNNYVDKTGLIGLINASIDTSDNLICISRPRRFGKSYAARMLCAYYDLSCDSYELFQRYEIAKDPSFEKHLNQYHVISLDISGFVSDAKMLGISMKEIPALISKKVLADVISIHPDLTGHTSLNDCILALVRKTRTKVVFIIDEWDAVIREAKTETEVQERYLSLLRGWFKNDNFTPTAVAAAYMTGILPIKKDGSQSAISDFREYTILDPLEYSEYVGFNETEVRHLCEEKNRSFDKIKKWYDGYTVGDKHSIYNPYSVMCALQSGKYTSYWKNTSAVETLLTYIDMDEEGLQQEVAKLIAGEKIEVDPYFFQNDIETFRSKDDVLTLLIHLGYLTYEEAADSYGDKDIYTGYAWIPNEEVRTEFEKILRKSNHKELIELVKKSDQLLKDTIAGNETAVASAFEQVRDMSYAPAYYNDEQSLRYAIKMAYISSIDQYARVEEMPSGHGLADVVFIPKRKSPLPAMVVELKWDKPVDGAITQIKDRNYPAFLKGYGGDIILAGITYDEQTKHHTCKIEKAPI